MGIYTLRYVNTNIYIWNHKIYKWFTVMSCFCIAYTILKKILAWYQNEQESSACFESVSKWGAHWTSKWCLNSLCSNRETSKHHSQETSLPWNICKHQYMVRDIDEIFTCCEFKYIQKMMRKINKHLSIMTRENKYHSLGPFCRMQLYVLENKEITSKSIRKWH